jgi:hypothetical protein
MPVPVKLAKAELRQLDAEFRNEINRENWMKVQFNPESIKVSFANQISAPSGGGDQRGTPRMQFVGAGTTKLSLQLWFDINAEMPEGETAVNDVRKLTQKVAYYITPTETTDNPPKFVPPSVRFLWGSFQFDGIMEAMEESLEFFSDDGRPMRASVTLNLTQQKIQRFVIRDTGAQPGTNRPGGAAPGTQPLTPAPAGSTVQGLADSQGKGGSWQGIAAANGIENPRLLQPGQLLNLNITAPTVAFNAPAFSTSVGVSARANAGISGTASIEVSER